MNESSSASNSCPKCGAVLPSAATAGLCPRCLMAEAMVPTQTDAEAAGSRRTHAPEELAPHFPQLEILECLGRGGMGVVYKARQKSLNRFVALKLLAPERVDHAGFAERFQKEALALAALNHPHIVTVYDFGQAGGFYFLLMEFVDGVNLRQAMKAGRFTPEQALAIVPPVCEAMQYAHAHGIVHRDIKPENLLLDKEGRVKIADFGIAKMVGSAPGIPARQGEPAEERQAEVPASLSIGTPQYMAPEQKAHGKTDHRADIYSLGVVLYELLTGELPGKPIEPPSRKVVVDVRLDEVVLRALEKEPERRYQQASVLKTQVETILATPSGAPSGTTNKSEIVRICEILYSDTITSPLATKLLNVSLLGILGLLGFLGLVPLPGWHRCFGFFGFFGFSGLIGVAFIVEMLARRKGAQPGASLRHITVVGRRNGKAVIHWPGVLLGLVLALTIVEVAAIVSSLILYDRINTMAVLIALWGAIIVIGAGIRRGLTTPVDRLMSLDEPDGAATSSAETPPRFSRMAIVGAVWASFALVAPVLRLLESSGVVLPAGSSLPADGQWLWLLVRMAPALGYTAFFGTTILGCVALAQIRRSSRKLYGLGLALFDALLFPLLALGGLIGGLLYLFLSAIWKVLMGHLQLDGIGVPASVFLSISLSALVDFLIIRWAWRAAKTPLDGDSSSAKWSWRKRMSVAAVALLSLCATVCFLWVQRPRQQGGFISQESSDGRYMASAGTWHAMRIFGGDRLTYRFRVQGVGGSVSERWEIPVPSGKLATSYLSQSLSDLTFDKHGHIEWLADSSAVEFLVRDIEVARYDVPKREASIGSSPAAPQTGTTALDVDKTTSGQVVVEDLALRILAAIRDKEDEILKSLTVDRIKGWRDALPQFAFEMRERFHQMTGKPFEMRVAKSIVEGDMAVVQCTGPETLNGTYLVLFFVKTANGWRNWSLRNSPPSTPLKEHLRRKPPGEPETPPAPADNQESSPAHDQAPPATSATDGPPAAQSLSFGPVTERVVNDLDEGRANEALHLQTGTLPSVRPRESRGADGPPIRGRNFP